jgi:hypothetical protein
VDPRHLIALVIDRHELALRKHLSMVFQLFAGVIIKMILMFLFSYLVAWLITASADPLSCFVQATAILCIVVASYLSGIAEGRAKERTANGRSATLD